MKPITSKSTDNSDVFQTCPCLASRYSLEPGSALISASICLRMSTVGSVIVVPFRIEGVDLTSLLTVSVGSIILRLQNRRRVPKPNVVGCLCDDPDPLPLAGDVRRQNAAAVDQGGIVSLAILFVEAAPIAGHVPPKELTGLLTRIPKG